MIANMASAAIPGQMEDNTLANGLMESSMEKENINKLEVMLSRQEFGKMGKEFNGLND